jgi:hypothetical protein
LGVAQEAGQKLQPLALGGGGGQTRGETVPLGDGLSQQVSGLAQEGFVPRQSITEPVPFGLRGAGADGLDRGEGFGRPLGFRAPFQGLLMTLLGQYHADDQEDDPDRREEEGMG